MSNYLYVLLSFVVIASLFATPAHAQDKNPEAIDEIFGWARADTPGCAVAASLNGKVVVNRAYGAADLEREVPISPSTVFDIGSVQKQFVAAATLVLVEDGRIALADDVRKYVPELPDYGHKITVDHLLTHTSGIRDWTGILPLAAGDPDALQVILRQRALNFAPGEEWSYSNSGYVLLKEIVVRTSGMSFAEFARKRLFEPLGMKTTAYRTDLREIVKNRALAYEKEGGHWKTAMLLDNDRGGGALLTTTGDLLVWNDALTGHRLGASVSGKLQEPATLNNGRKLDYGRALFLDTYRGASEVAHTGSAAGYKAYLGRYPAQGLSIAILCNSGDDTDRRAFAHRIYDLFVPATGAPDGDRNAPAANADAAAAAEPELGSKAGLFFSERTGEPLRLAVDRGRLRVAGGPALVPLSDNRFKRSGAALQFLSQDEFEVHFTSPDAFELRSMDGKTTRYRRASPYAPTAADLKAFAGRYESVEIGTVFEIAPGEGGLTVRLEHSPEKRLDLKAVAPDTFQVSRMTLRFVRDKDGKVVALDYSNPLLRNIEFTRLR